MLCKLDASGADGSKDDLFTVSLPATSLIEVTWSCDELISCKWLCFLLCSFEADYCLLSSVFAI